MNLNTYLKKYMVTIKEFMEKTGLSRPTIARLRDNPKWKPSTTTIKRVLEATSGEVDLRDL